MAHIDTIIAIDPGKDGAVAIIQHGALIAISKFINHINLCELVEPYEFVPQNTLGIIEELHAIFGARAAATFGMGKRCGYWEGVFDSWGIPFIFVKPTDWQRAVTTVQVRPQTRGLPKGERTKILANHKLGIKTESIRAAHAAFPHAGVTHDGVADAINIARYAWKILSNEGTYPV